MYFIIIILAYVHFSQNHNSDFPMLFPCVLKRNDNTNVLFNLSVIISIYLKYV